MSVTLHFSSLTEPDMRTALLAIRHEFQVSPQPTHIASSYAAEHDAGNVGAIVRVSGPSCYEVTSFPLSTGSAAIVLMKLSESCEPGRFPKMYRPPTGDPT